MIISIASGKGGTGKTTVAVNMALSIDNAQYIDCDVEEPNGHLFLKPTINKRYAVSTKIPKINESKCNLCGRCSEICEFNAITVFPKTTMVFAEMCHGCGACMSLCPSNAIETDEKAIGIIEKGFSGNIEFVHGKLNLKEVLSPHLIKAVKREINREKTVIIDAPPGTSCAMVSTVNKSDYTILVTEPTPFGLNDLSISVDVLKNLNVPFGIVINKSDMGDDCIKKFCSENNIPILLEIPFSKKIAELYSTGIPLVSAEKKSRIEFRTLFDKIREYLL